MIVVASITVLKLAVRLETAGTPLVALPGIVDVTVGAAVDPWET